MLDKETLTKEIAYISKVINEIEVALSLEKELRSRVGLSSALGGLKSARAWLVDINKGAE